VDVGAGVDVGATGVPVATGVVVAVAVGDALPVAVVAGQGVQVGQGVTVGQDWLSSPSQATATTASAKPRTTSHCFMAPPPLLASSADHTEYSSFVLSLTLSEPP
jgi:hypothetical protein